MGWNNSSDSSLSLYVSLGSIGGLLLSSSHQQFVLCFFVHLLSDPFSPSSWRRGILFQPPIFLLFYSQGLFLLRVLPPSSSTFTPVFQHAEEIIPATSVLRCFGQLENQRLLHYGFVDTSTRAEDAKFQVFAWILIRLDALSAAALAAVIALLIGLREQISRETIGSSLSLGIYLSMLIVKLGESWVWLQIEGAHADRLWREIQSIPQERKGGSAVLPLEWPSRHCLVEFDNCCLRYRPGLPLVLRGVSLRFGGKERVHVGIVGRTGAGKSSMLSAILRLAELDEGRIMIDGIDISTVPLQQLRRRIVIIPQEGKQVFLLPLIAALMVPFSDFI